MLYTFLITVQPLFVSQERDSIRHYFLGGSDSAKRNDPANPNDLFWANRGKKSDPEAALEAEDDDDGSVRSKRDNGGLSGLGAMRPNSFMNMYMGGGGGARGFYPKPKRAAVLRPNSFLFPSVGGKHKRAPKWNSARPNSMLFPSISQGSFTVIAYL